MSENIIELRTIPLGKILNEKFSVPRYQRGYRWTDQQVKDLLNDIDEFNSQEGEGNFYCLQPLVVKADGDSYEVIDGQQRLTTIFLILKYLGTSQKECLESYLKEPLKGELKNISEETLNDVLYSLTYETRKDSKDFLEKIDKKSEKEARRNIDFFHMYRAYHETIKDWFESKREDNKDFLRKLLNDVQFIWYKTDEANPIEVFTRLNIGKIALTNAELIRALFLSNSMYRGIENDNFREEIARDWDEIEYKLQTEEFWLFLNSAGYEKPTRIDMIFDIIYILKRFGEPNVDVGKDSYKTFRYFYNAFNGKDVEQSHNEDNGKSNIMSKWKEVKGIFQTFKEWFDDPKLYHYIGFLIAREGSRQKAQSADDSDTEEDSDNEDMHTDAVDSSEVKAVLLELLQEWQKEGKSKDEFLESLKKRIWKAIGIGGNDTGAIGEVDKKLEKTYGDIKRWAPLLLFYNIQSEIAQCEDCGTLGSYRFPFNTYKIEKWNVEHIDSNTPNDESDPAVQKEWVLPFYASEGISKKLKERIRNFYNNNEHESNEFNSIKEDVNKALKLKRKSLSEDKNGENEKNQIMNFALLDENTNKSYKNSIFSAKRRVIMKKEQGKKISPPKEITKGKPIEWVETSAKSKFVPRRTRDVFSKSYNPTSSDSNYWTKQDGESYKKDISDVLKKFFNPIENKNA